MRIDRIYFDMDGVLADFNRGVEELCGLPALAPGESPAEHDEEMWRRIALVDHFYDRLEPVSGALEMFRALYSAYGDRCEILTGIPKPKRHLPEAADDKTRWVHRLLGADIVVHTVYAEQKKDYCLGPQSLLIDDLEKNISAWRSTGGTGILFRSSEQALADIRQMDEA